MSAKRPLACAASWSSVTRGSPRGWSRRARAANLNGLFGAELTVEVPGGLRTGLVCLVESREGWGNLCTLITRARLDEADEPGAQPAWHLDRELGAEKAVEVRRARRRREPHRAADVVVVGERERVEVELGGALDEALRVRRAVEQREG
ncbi:MAG TPA: hypothetical protein VM764_02935, partial [Gemmatimonadaceae bacterium]|nr:hypothetical protein [Gemmatimonadaceae bacterium]